MKTTSHKIFKNQLTILVPDRVNLLDEANADASETSAVLSSVNMAQKDICDIILKIVTVASLLRGNQQTSGSAMNNLSRSLILKPERMLLIMGYLLLNTSLGNSCMNTLGFGRLTIERNLKTSSLVIFLLFLSGKLDELKSDYIMLRPTIQTPEPTLSRITTTEFVSRFLLVESLSSLALVVLPYINVRENMKLVFKRIFPDWIKHDAAASCACCSSDAMVFPRTAFPCNHMYCYYCACSKEASFRCDKCRSVVSSFSN